MTDTIKISTVACPHCSRSGEISMPISDYESGIAAYKSGAYIQNAFPNLTADQRELLMTGIHPECWKQMFPDDDEED